MEAKEARSAPGRLMTPVPCLSVPLQAEENEYPAAPTATMRGH
jgi:hypothetical protein